MPQAPGLDAAQATLDHVNATHMLIQDEVNSAALLWIKAKGWILMLLSGFTLLQSSPARMPREAHQ